MPKRARAPRAPRAAATSEAILASHTPEVRRIAQRLRDLIKDVVPEAAEAAYPGWHGIGYRHPRAEYFCGIFPRERSVKLAFEWGALLDDQDSLLAAGGKRVRYVELADPDAIPEQGLAGLLLEAIRLRS